MRTATTILRNEHLAILERLDQMEEAAARLERDEHVPPETLQRLVPFFRKFAEGNHVAKEERFLFPLLEKKDASQVGAPIGMMLSEHQQAHSLLTFLDELTAAYAAGDAEAGPRWAQTARNYTSLMRFHVNMENQVLLLVAESLLSEEEQDELAAAFDRPKDSRPLQADCECPSLWIG